MTIYNVLSFWPDQNNIRDISHLLFTFSRVLFSGLYAFSMFNGLNNFFTASRNSRDAFLPPCELLLNALGRIIETSKLRILRQGVYLPFRRLVNRPVEKKDYHKWPKEGNDGKNTFLVSETSLLRSHPFSQKYSPGLYRNIPYPRNGPMDSGIGMSYMRSTNNILGDVTVPSYVKGDLTIALYRSRS